MLYTLCISRRIVSNNNTKTEKAKLCFYATCCDLSNQEIRAMPLFVSPVEFAFGWGILPNPKAVVDAFLSIPGSPASAFVLT